MKRVAAAALLLLVSAASARAQWSFGLKGGLGQGSFTGQNEFEWKPSALRASAFFSRALNGKFSIQPEVMLSEKIGESDNVPGTTLTFTATYLEIPVLARYTAFSFFGVKGHLLAGPVLSYRVGCNLQFFTPGPPPFTSDGQCDLTTGKDLIDFGGVGAFALSRSLGATTIHIEARGGANVRGVVVPLETEASRSLSWGVLAGVSVPFRFRRPSFGSVPEVRVAEAPQTQAPATVPQALPDVLPPLDIAGSGLVAVPAATTVSADKRITLTASDADARTLLLAIAKESGISMVVSDDVRRRVSVSFSGATPEEAIAAIIAQAGLTLARAPSPAFPPVVYYQLPVNVNQAPAETIAARFGVSLEMARWIANSRSSDRP